MKYTTDFIRESGIVGIAVGVGNMYDEELKVSSRGSVMALLCTLLDLPRLLVFRNSSVISSFRRIVYICS